MEQQPHGPNRFRHRKSRNFGSTMASAVLVVIVILIVAYLALSWHGVPTVTSTQTISVLNGQSAYFRLENSTATYSLYLENSSSAYAVIYVSKVPVLTAPIVTFGLVNGQSANISADASSQDADLQVKLLSSTLSGASIELISIPPLFTLKVSPGVQVRYPASFYTINNAISVTPPPPVNTTKNTTKTTTNKTTTTPAPTKSSTTPLQNISTILNTTYIGTLMNEYDALYARDRSCTEAAYNTTLVVYTGQQPVGPFSFTNVSSATPTSVTTRATQQSKNNYAIAYSVVTPSSSTSGVVATMNISLSSGVVTNLAFKGIFSGLNYSEIESDYNFQNGVSGTCGAYIP